VSLNNPSDLDDQLRDTGTEYDDIDFEKNLRQANNRLESTVGRRFIEYKTIEFEDETDVETDWSNLESFDKVVNVNGEGNEIVDDSNYSVDLSTGTISFDQSYVDDNFFEGLVLKLYYVPTAYKDLELYFAQRNIQEMQTIQTTDQVNNTQTDRLNQRIEALIKRINSRNSVSTQSGDNQNRGSEPVRGFTGSP